MSSANANSSNEERKELEIVAFNSTAFEFDNEVVIIPPENTTYTFELGLKEIAVYSNGKEEKDGKTTRINPKTGKPYITRTIPKRLEQKQKTAHIERG